MKDKRLFEIISREVANEVGANFAAVHISREAGMDGERYYLSQSSFRDDVVRVLSEIASAHRVIGSDVVFRILSDAITEIEQL